MLTIPSVISNPVTMRSRLMLEVASELVAASEWSEKQVIIHFRPQGDEAWRLCFFASDAPSAVNAVVSGKVDIAVCNPSGVLTMALRGKGPFSAPVPVRAIIVLPQFDQLGFAVTRECGLTSLAQLRQRRYPLRVSLRRQRDHSVHVIINEVLATYGFTLDDIEEWGGRVQYDEGLPDSPNRLGAIERGEIDAIFDEALPCWGARALQLGMRFLSVDEPQLRHLETQGLRRAVVLRQEYPGLPEDVWTVDFSGWPVFCLECTSDRVVTAFCVALERRKDRIPWYGQGPLRLNQMCRDTKEGPLDIPLHPAAEAYWRRLGYIE